MKQISTLALLFAASIGQVLAQCPPGETEITMQIITDRYGEETTWEVTGPGGTPTHASGGPYTQASASGEYPQPAVTFCVPNGSILEVLVEDSYGDGMCCAYGDGSWTLSAGGTTIATGGTFGTEQSATVALGTDLGISSLGFNNIIAQGSTPITGTVTNMGITPISSFTLAYSIDGGAAVSQDFTATVPPGGSYNFSFSTPWQASVGDHELVITLSQVANDLIASNNEMTVPIGVATQSVSRRTIVEEFTSSTCAPCASLNETFDPLLNSMNTNEPGSNILAVKYQMNWPSPGNDPSYNADGNTRKNYYGVDGIPSVFIDGGEPMGATWQGAINGAADMPAFCDVMIEHVLTGTTADVTVTVTPYANFAGSHKLYIAATENYYYYPASTTSQDDFHYAMRKMMPNGNGITISNMTAGVPQTFTESHTFTIGNPAQNNYNTWSSWLNNITFVAFVQNQSNKTILQAAMSEVTTNVNELGSELDLNVYPNPTTGILNIGVDLTAASRMDITLTNVVGEVLVQRSNVVNAGQQNLQLDLGSVANGTYYLTLRSNETVTTRKVTVRR